YFFFSSRRRHTRFSRDWSSDVCSSDLPRIVVDADVGASGVLLEQPGEGESRVAVPLQVLLVRIPQNADFQDPELFLPGPPHESGQFFVDDVTDGRHEKMVPEGCQIGRDASGMSQSNSSMTGSSSTGPSVEEPPIFTMAALFLAMASAAMAGKTSPHICSTASRDSS